MVDDMGTFTRGQIMAARENDPLWPKPELAPAAGKATAAQTTPKRLCEICDTNIDDAHPRAKTCHKEDCKRELTNRRLRRNREAKQAASATPSDQVTPQPQPQAAPAPEAEAASEHPPAATASLLRTAPSPVGDAEDSRDSDDSARLGRIEAAAEKFLEACARERTVQQVRITAERRLTEALSVGQGT